MSAKLSCLPEAIRTPKLSINERRHDGAGGWLYHLGEPLEVSWCTEGRRATAVEAGRYFTQGADRLRALAIDGGPEAVHEFDRLYDRALTLLPEH